MASRAAFRGEAPDEMPYGASKGALVTLTKTIARGFATDGVLAFCIAPRSRRCNSRRQVILSVIARLAASRQG